MCGVDLRARVASYGAHHGEEAVLVGQFGSGAVFLSGCNLGCAYCQNWSISQRRDGTDLTARELATIFLRIQTDGCHNLNLVTPTHQAHALVEGLAVAVAGGFDLPIVWNCGGYEALSALRLLEGIVDIYMPDAKYGDDATALRLSGIPDYVVRSRIAIREMHRQVGDLAIDADGIARRGLLVRHLVLPDGLAGTPAVMRFLAEEISPNTYINVMDQYHASYRAGEIPSMDRRISPAERNGAIRAAEDAGLHRFA
jgi:putative pyruvate formate lyase activating enzyme